MFKHWDGPPAKKDCDRVDQHEPMEPTNELTGVDPLVPVLEHCDSLAPPVTTLGGFGPEVQPLYRATNLRNVASQLVRPFHHLRPEQ